MELSDEIIEHMMAPKNYGKLDDPGGVGIGYDERSGEYVILYLGKDTAAVNEIAFATNGCQDTVVLGSVFTEMVKGAGIDEATTIMHKMEEKVADAPEKQRACSELVLTAFNAALQNLAHRTQGGEEELHRLPIASSCATEETK
ncbi:iron-sulfur cluster assembly scaffold protein [Sulfurimonas sp. HSL-3221]|uniref:iron-sulfur cluster assembly scaffold protein n=1 Tax=Sulfurimonadaceae TaxID=2771471 RepID=UPI001E473EDA|nr:iron-sulfur cluster assembly scaffold protein [Sulfurimonas sp. HSL-3221]UFS63505.1 iron-sulfur cluster assembly scaffold protein [Sulfurimonas sp. HSL-3221]